MVMDFVQEAVEKIREERSASEKSFSTHILVAETVSRLAILLASEIIGLELYSANHKALMSAAGW